MRSQAQQGGGRSDDLAMPKRVVVIEYVEFLPGIPKQCARAPRQPWQDQTKSERSRLAQEGPLRRQAASFVSSAPTSEKEASKSLKIGTNLKKEFLRN